MDDNTKQKILAGAKIGYGVARCASAVAFATGHGLLAAVLKGPIARPQITKALLDAGTKTISEGVDDWNRVK